MAQWEMRSFLLLVRSFEWDFSPVAWRCVRLRISTIWVHIVLFGSAHWDSHADSCSDKPYWWSLLLARHTRVSGLVINPADSTSFDVPQFSWQINSNMNVVVECWCNRIWRRHSCVSWLCVMPVGLVSFDLLPPRGTGNRKYYIS